MEPETDDRPLDGVIETADPETGEAELMGFWLPQGVSSDALGLERVLSADAIGDAP